MNFVSVSNRNYRKIGWKWKWLWRLSSGILITKAIRYEGDNSTKFMLYRISQNFTKLITDLCMKKIRLRFNNQASTGDLKCSSSKIAFLIMKTSILTLVKNIFLNLGKSCFSGWNYSLRLRLSEPFGQIIPVRRIQPLLKTRFQPPSDFWFFLQNFL